jgi:fimbrial isopeptide formation D2 family protein/uncharacterized repeat protein (TIGR01451 family)
MPRDNVYGLNLNMFRFQFQNNSSAPGLRLIRLANWLGNGSFFLTGDRRSTNVTDTYIVNKLDAQRVSMSFRLHLTQAEPKGLSANMTTRVVDGYDVATMEWATAAAGPYSSGAPVVPATDCSIYVRYAETDYSTDPVDTAETFGKYRKLLAGPYTIVTFGADITEADPEIVKTFTNLTPHTDGKVHVNDRLLYTITVSNKGEPNSKILHPTVTDTVPAGMTFTPGSVKIETVSATIGTNPGQYTFDNSKDLLTVYLADIVGGAHFTVTFEATVKADAYGVNIKNTARVTGKDDYNDDDLGDDDIDEDDDDENDEDTVDRAPKPTIDPITVGDTEISGTGTASGSIVVTFPNGATVTVPVNLVGTEYLWTADVPTGLTLVEGQVVKAYQTKVDMDDSEEVTETVVDRPPSGAGEYKKFSVNKTPRLDGTIKVGDTLIYTITAKNIGPAKSLLSHTIIDPLPEEVDFVLNSVAINGVAVGSPTAVYEAATHTLTIELANVPSGATWSITFEAVINETAYGKAFKNTADVAEEDIPVIPTDRSPKPVFDTINEGDRVITGTGVIGATVELTLPHYAIKPTAPVTDDGTGIGVWTVTVPPSVNLFEGDKVTATQTVPTLDPSEVAEAIVEGKTHVVPFIKKTSENLDNPDPASREAHVGDRIEFTITVRNDGPKSFWSNVIVIDEIPDGVTYTGGVLLDGVVPTFSSWNPTTKTLSVTIRPDPIPYGVEHKVTFIATVDADAYGKNILNSARVTGKDSGGDPDTDDETDDDDGGWTIKGQTAPPEINTIYREDPTVSGTGIIGAVVTVTFPGGGTKTYTVVDDGTGVGVWTVDVPTGVTLQIGNVVTATQKEGAKDESDPASETVLDKTFRAVHGFVWPMLVDNSGLGQAFVDMHAVIVELRPTLMTPAAAALSVKSVLVNATGLGEFTIPNVPFGDYILTVIRPGYLTRAMKVSVTAADLDMIELSPPLPSGAELGEPTEALGPDGRRVFRLWWGDFNGDFIIESKDVMKLMGITDLPYTVEFGDVNYTPYCDPNGDGRIEGQDMMYLMEMLGRQIFDYAGFRDIEIE